MLIFDRIMVTRFGLTFLAHPVHYTHTHPFNGPLSGTTQVSRYQNGKTSLVLLK